jgi:hypothetical protein
MNDLALSLLMLAAVLLTARAIWQWRREGPSRNVLLLLVLVAVMLANVAIWTIPDKNGAAPIDRAAAGPG